MGKLLFIAILLSGRVFALQTQPWFSEVYEFMFLSKYAYGQYSKVNKALVQPGRTTHTHLLHFDLGIAVSPEWCLDGDLEFTSTAAQSFGVRSTALQARYLSLDDIIGDPVTLIWGFNTRYTFHRSIRDVSCPYHGDVDFEGNAAIGKEFEFKFSDWRSRLWGFGALGLATAGSPWLRGILGFEGNYREEHRLVLLLFGSHGFGRRHHINISEFHGYGRIRQKSVDLALRYGVRLGVWGMLSFEYKRRLLAKLCPEGVNTFSISYRASFSF